MTASGGPSRGHTDYGSQVNDDDIINNQIQADLISQTKLHQTDPPNKAKKRRSRDEHESYVSDHEESSRKKWREKNKKQRKDKENSETPRESEPETPHESLLSGAESLSKHMKDTDPIDESTNLWRDKVRRDSSLSAVTGRYSLGSNRDALLRSILKGCSPTRSMDVKSDHVLHSESESGDESTGLNVSKVFKTPSKARIRPKGSMIPFLPEGYKPDLTGSKGRFHCPIEGCDKVYTRRSTLGEHMNTSHSGQRLRDNKDGTMSMISLAEYELAISHGNNQTVVEIPEASHPTKPTESSSRRLSAKKKENGLSNVEVIGKDSVNPDNTDEANVRKPPEAINRPEAIKPEKTPIVSEQTTSKGGRMFNNTHEISEEEMEDWELEPGVIEGSEPNSDDDSETEHNTAYSSIYTTSAERGIKFPGVHFQVIRVVPGLIALGPDVPYLRICSVAAGKVQVQLGETQFSIGAHGMWRIRAGEKCILKNRHYSEAMIHVSTINMG